VFGRNSRSTQTVEPTAAPAKEGGKGRPTPKRREAEQGRRRAITAPATRKEAYRRTRERQREERQRTMVGLRAGDERHLPPRDRGPVRKYARDMVDARRSVAEFFLPLALVILILNFTSDPRVKLVGSMLWMLLVVLIVLDSILVAFRLRRGLHRSYPDESHRGALPYALMRSMQIRRFRLPPPRVKPGKRR
jgi:DUF3043 family protein